MASLSSKGQEIPSGDMNFKSSVRMPEFTASNLIGDNLKKYVPNRYYNEHFFGVPKVNGAFIDRPSIWNKMTNTPAKETSSVKRVILALNGRGGAGKTQLMLRYCYYHRDQYDFIFWLRADNWMLTANSIRSLAINLGFDERAFEEEYADEKMIKWVRGWLERTPRWLLLLDNADSQVLGRLPDVLPRQGGTIILSTRETVSMEEAVVIHVDKMEEEEALSLLHQGSTMESINVETTKFHIAKELVAELEYMPLAIELARAFIKNTSQHFQEYLALFKRCRDRMFPTIHQDSPDPHDRNIATICNILFEHLRRVDPIAMNILEICAFLQPNNIPVQFFGRQFSRLKLDSTLLASFKRGLNVDFPCTVSTSLDTISTFSLASFDNNDKRCKATVFTIHPLVQKTIYEDMSEERRMHLVLNLADALDIETEFNCVYNPHSREIMDVYAQHILHFASVFNNSYQNEPVSERFCSLLNRTIYFLLHSGFLVGLERLSEFSVLASQSIYESEHTEIATSLNNLATLFRYQSDYARAEQLYEKALAIRENILGLEHSKSATSLNNLACLYHYQFDFDRALLLFQRALTIYERSLGYEHPFTITILNNLAECHNDQGNYDRAEPLYQKLLAIDEKLSGSEHLATAVSLSNLADIYQSQYKCSSAEPLYTKALSIKEKLLGRDHLNVIDSLNDLSSLYHVQGNFNKASSISTQSLRISSNLSDIENTCMDFLYTLYEQAGFYHDLKEYNKNEHIYQRSLATEEIVLEFEHPLPTKSLKHLAHLFYQARNMDDKAEPIYMRVLEAQEKILGTEHPYVAISLDSLAEFHRYKENYDKAEPFYERALEIREKAWGSDHIFLANSLDNLAWVCLGQDNNSKADPLYQRALEIIDRNFGPEHPDTIRYLEDMITCYLSYGKREQAELLHCRLLSTQEKQLESSCPNELNFDIIYTIPGTFERAKLLYQRLLIAQETLLGSEHKDVAKRVEELAYYYKYNRKYEEYESQLQRAMAIREKSHGLVHPDTRRSLGMLVRHYCDQSDYEKAESILHRAYGILESELGPDHPDTRDMLQDFAKLYYNKGDLYRAEIFYKRMLEISEKEFGHDHPDNVDYINKLASFYCDKKDYGNAELLYQRSLDINAKTLGPDPETVVSMNRLAEFYLEQKELEKSETHYKNSLEITAIIEGPDTLYSARIQLKLASIYRQWGQYEKAASLYQQSLSVFEHIFGSNDEDTITILCDLGTLYQKWGYHTMAQSFFKRVLEFREKTLGTDHSDTNHIRALLENIEIHND
ncbi:uncharacterized protein VTP21DRAFT_386 [Calcarisporiella thermophila]|uniref:uncharacterized protein n=1 Tax=Calcarisporiella thermophila TaxID=911321 RepID=UPI0037444024